MPTPENSTHIFSAPRQGKVVAVFTSDPLLGLDLTQALEANGYCVWDARGYPLDMSAQGDSAFINAAIVDLKFGDARARHTVTWTADRNIPTIILSTDDNADAGLANTPNVVMCFSKPLCVDRIMPQVVSATKTTRG